MRDPSFNHGRSIVSLANNTCIPKRQVDIRQLFGSQPGWRRMTLPRTVPHIDSEPYHAFTDQYYPALCTAPGMYVIVLGGVDRCLRVTQSTGVPHS
jgi:hypothetical protein